MLPTMQHITIHWGMFITKEGNIIWQKKFLKKALSLKPDNSEIRKHIDELLNIS